MRGFSSRLPADLEANEFSRLISDRRGSSIDLTESNPTNVGLGYPRERLERILSGAGILPYEPDPRGLFPAREAIAKMRSVGGRALHPDRLWLTSGTSEAYSFLIKLLADPGEEILIPTPGYPLFRHLLALEGVRPVSYPLRYAEGWFTDLAALREAAGPKTRAVILVHPNNPTGQFVRDSEREELWEFARERSLPLIVDEVFLEYPLLGSSVGRSFAQESPVLTFVLDGLSKLFGLPQLKLSWISLHGPEEGIARVVPGLDWISDLYLSVGTPIQRAIPSLRPIAGEMTSMIGERINRNHLWLKERFQGGTIRYLSGEGGWSAILRLPDSMEEEKFALRLVREKGVVAQPGYFFDLPFRSSLVVSLLPEPERFREGIDRIGSLVKEEG